MAWEHLLGRAGYPHVRDIQALDGAGRRTTSAAGLAGRVETIDPSVLIPGLIILTATGVLKGSIGFGFPLVAVPILSIFVGTKEAILLMSLPVFATNALLLAQRPVDRRAIVRVAPIIVGLVPATIVGAALLSEIDPRALSVLLGIVTALFALISFVRVRLAVPRRFERPASLAVGAAGGLLQGSTSVPGPLFAIYLTGLGLDKRVFVYTITALFSIGNVMQILSYARLGLYGGGSLLLSLALVPAGLVGQQIGFAIQDRLHPEMFRRVVLVTVTLAGANLVARGLGVL